MCVCYLLYVKDHFNECNLREDFHLHNTRSKSLINEPYTVVTNTVTLNSYFSKMAVDLVEDGVCRSCDRVVKENDFALGCDGLCEKWFHIKCISVGKKDYDKFIALGEKSVWFCDTCKIEVKALITARKELLKFGKSVGKSDSPAISIIMDEINVLNSNFSMLERRLFDLECSRKHADDDIGLTSLSTTRLTSHALVSNSVSVTTVNDDTVPTPTTVEIDSDENPKITSRMAECRNEVKVAVHEDEEGSTSIKTKCQNIVSDCVGEQVESLANRPRLDTEVEPNLSVNTLEEANVWKKVGPKRTKRNDLSSVNRPSTSVGLHGRQVVVGSMNPSEVRNIAAVERHCWLFISRLATSVTSENIVSHVKSICGNISVVSEELRTKFPGYKSFKLRVPLECKDNILNTEVWPQGVLVSKFLFPKSQQTLQNISSAGNNNFLGRAAKPKANR